MGYSTQWRMEMRENLTTHLNTIKKRFTEARRESERLPRSVNDLKSKLKSLETAHDRAYSTKHIRQYRQEILKTRQELDRLKVSQKTSLSSRFGQATSALGISPGAMIGGGLAFGAMRLGQDALRDIRELEKSMSNVKAITGATGQEFQLLKATAIRLGADTKFTSIEAAEAMTFLGMAGFKTNQIIEALPHTLNLAAAGNMDLARSADIVSNIMGQFNITAYNTDRVTNVLAATATSSNTNIEQLSEAMKYLGPTAKALGMSIEETAGIVGVLGDSGIQGSMAGRALGTSLVNLTNPTQKVRDAMKNLNLQVFDAKGNFVGMKEFLRQVEEGTKGMTQEQKAANLSRLLGNEAFQEMNILLQKGAAGYDEFTRSITGTNKALEMAETQMDNWAGDIEKMGGAWDSFVQGLNGSEGVISNFFRGMTQEITKVISAFNALNQGFTNTARMDIVKGWTGHADKVASNRIKDELFRKEANDLVTQNAQDKSVDKVTSAKQLIAQEEFKVKKITEELEKQAQLRSKNIANGLNPLVGGISSQRQITAAEKEYSSKLVDMLATSKAKIKTYAGVLETEGDSGEGKSAAATSFDTDESSSKAGIGRVKGEGVKHIVMNVQVPIQIKYSKDNDKAALKKVAEKMVDIVVDSARDALVTAGEG